MSSGIRTTEFGRNVTEFSIQPELNHGIPLITEFREIRIPPEMFLDGMIYTLIYRHYSGKDSYC